MKSVKKTKKGSIVAGSPAIQEHEAMMQEVRDDSRYSDAEKSADPQQPVKGAKPGSVFSQYQDVPTKNVQTRIPFDMYQRMLTLKMQKEQQHRDQTGKSVTISIGELTLNAIEKYLQSYGI